MKLFHYSLLIILVIFLACTKTDPSSSSVTLLVSNNVRAQLDPCGWKKNPLGGLSRKSTYVKQLKEDGKKLVILDAGDLLFSAAILVGGNEQADKLRANAILKGYERIGCHAVNVGGFDLAAGTAFLQQIVDSTEIPFISANIIDAKSRELLFPPHHIITEGGVTIGVIGLTNLIPTHINDVKVSDFIKTGEAQIAKLKPQVDIIVVLANVNRNMNKAMNAAFADADYIFLSRNTVRTRPGTKQPVMGHSPTVVISKGNI